LDSQLKVTGTSAIPGRQQRVLDSAFAESPILGNQLAQNAHAPCANRFGLVGLGRRPAVAVGGWPDSWPNSTPLSVWMTSTRNGSRSST
jgi:hypothetical protein